jgi:hypothetical protein
MATSSTYGDDELLTEFQLAEARNLKVNSLRADRRKRRLIPFLKLGKSVRYQLKRVDPALATYEVGGPDAVRNARSKRAAKREVSTPE